MKRRIGCQVTCLMFCGLFCLADCTNVHSEQIAQRGPQGGALPQPWQFQTPTYRHHPPIANGQPRNAYPSPVIQPGQYPAGPQVPPTSRGNERGGFGNSWHRRQPMPVVIPQIYGYPPVANPATLGGQIEIVPNVRPQRSRSRATYQVVPTDPLPQVHPNVELLPPPSRPDYIELPPPPR